MPPTDTIIIGAGHAGLAMSRCLTERGIDHAVLERGRVAERWRGRWDSLHLLTPNWMTRLPGHAYQGDDPDGFMTRDEVIALLEGYARAGGAPVHEGVTVTAVRRSGTGFVVEAGTGTYEAANVVVATGHADLPAVPAALASGLDPAIHQIHSSQYRNPGALPAGGVLVVGAGASGMQIATELHRHRRRTLVAAGRHSQTPRRYRGRDMWWWLDAVGTLSTTADRVVDIEAARRAVSLSLSGADGGADLDLGVVQRRGIEVTGRLAATAGTAVRFDGGLAANAAAANAVLTRLLDRFDAHAASTGLDAVLEPPTRPLPVRVPDRPIDKLDLAAEGITSVLWSTGYRRSYPWLELQVTDDRGEIVHHRGVTPEPGLYVIGLRFLWTRRSHFIDGVAEDATYLADHIGARTHRRELLPAS